MESTKELEKLAITPEEFAAMVGLSPLTIRLWMRRGKLPVCALGRRRLIPLEEARRFVKENTRPAVVGVNAA